MSPATGKPPVAVAACAPHNGNVARLPPGVVPSTRRYDGQLTPTIGGIAVTVTERTWTRAGRTTAARDDGRGTSPVEEWQPKEGENTPRETRPPQETERWNRLHALGRDELRHRRR
ncbi:unnamed protein product [Lampetra fluviatilis]